MKKIIFCCCFVVIGHSVYPLEKNQQSLVCSFVNLIMVWKTNQTIFEGVVILEYEGKMGRGGLGVLFVCFLLQIVVLTRISAFFFFIKKNQQQTVVATEVAVGWGGERILSPMISFYFFCYCCVIHPMF